MAKKLENSLVNMFLSLTGICVVVGALLGGFYELTKAPIEEANKAKQTNAIKAVAPEFETVGEQQNLTSANGADAILFPVMKGGEQVGAAVQVKSKKAFGGEITIMFGFDQAGNVTGFSVLQTAETPGLGSKIPTWFCEGGKGDVIGMNPGKNNMTVKKDGGEVEAITAATISSRAFCDALAQAYGLLNGNVEASTSATAVKAAAEAVEGAVEEAVETAEAELEKVGDAIRTEADNSNNQ